MRFRLLEFNFSWRYNALFIRGPVCSRRRLRPRKDDRPGRTRASNPSTSLLLASGINMIDDVHSTANYKNAQRQYIQVILRNLFINNHIVSHAIQKLLLLLSTVSVWHSLQCAPKTTRISPAGKNLPTTRNRFDRNGFDIYTPHSSSREKNSYINKKELCNR